MGIWKVLATRSVVARRPLDNRSEACVRRRHVYVATAQFEYLCPLGENKTFWYPNGILTDNHCYGSYSTFCHITFHNKYRQANYVWLQRAILEIDHLGFRGKNGTIERTLRFFVLIDLILLLVQKQTHIS